MTSRELLKDIVALKPAPRCGLWLGNPHPDSWPGLHRYFGTTTEEELRRKLGDDFRWISPSFALTTFPSPASKGIFGWAAEKTSHGQAGPLPGFGQHLHLFLPHFRWSTVVETQVYHSLWPPLVPPQDSLYGSVSRWGRVIARSVVCDCAASFRTKQSLARLRLLTCTAPAGVCARLRRVCKCRK